MATEEKILLQLQLDVSQVTENLKKVTNAAIELRKEQASLDSQMKQLRVTGQEGTATFDSLQTQYIQNKTALANLTKEKSNYEKQLLLVSQANKAEEGSYEQLLRQQQLASIELKNQEGLLEKNADGTIVLTDAYREAASKVEDAKSAIIAFDQGIKDGSSNVGLYGSAVKLVSDQLAASQKAILDIRFQIQQLNESFKNGNVDQAAFNAKLAELTSELNDSKTGSEALSEKLNELQQLAETGGQKFQSFRQELNAARNEAKKAQDQFEGGIINIDQLNLANQKFADLQERFQVFQKTTAALETGGKFQLIGQSLAGLAGGFAALNAGLGLISNDSENVQRSLLKVQQTMALFQGLREFSLLGKDIEALNLVFGLTKVKATEAAVATGALAATEGEAAVSSQALAAAQGEVAVATEGAKVETLGLNAAFLASPIGLILISVLAVIGAFELLAKSQKEAIQSATDEINGENDAHKETVTALKLKNDALIATAEIALSTAQAEKKSIDDVNALQNNVTQAKKQALKDEAVETKSHYDTLIAQQAQAQEILRRDLSDDEEKKAIDNLHAIQKELEANRNRNAEILTEAKKLDADVLLSNLEAEEKRKVLAEQVTTERIALIKSERQKEIAAEIESNAEKIRQLQKAEKENADLIAAIRAESAQKIKEIGFKFDLQELQERNKAAILLTKEGSDERVSAEIAALRSENEASLKLIIGNGELEQAKRLAIQADTNDKIVKLEEQRISRINALEKANTENILSVLDEQSSLFLEQKFKLILADEKAETDAAIKNGQDVTLIEAKFNKQRLDAENSFNESRIKAEDDLQSKLIQAKLINTPAGSDEETQLLLERENNQFSQQMTLIKLHQKQKFDAADNALKAELSLAGDNQDAQLKAWDDYFNSLEQANNNANADIEVATQTHIKNISDITLAGTNSIISSVQNVFNEFSQIANNIVDAQAGADAANLDALQAQGDQRKAAIQAQLDQITDANRGHLTEQQKQQQKYSKEIQQIDKELADARTATAKQEADQKKQIQKDAAAVDFVLGSAKIAASTAEAIAKAVAASPITFGQPFVAFAIANGIIQELVLATQTAKVLSLYSGGFTGKGDPRSVSTAIGNKPYEYHYEEYVIPARILAKPEVSSLVHNFIEPQRKGRYPLSPARSFASGGFASADILNNTNISVAGQPVQPINVKDLSSAIIDGLQNMPEPPAPIVIVQDISEAQARVAQVENRANVFNK